MIHLYRVFFPMLRNGGANLKPTENYPWVESTHNSLCSKLMIYLLLNKWLIFFFAAWGILCVFVYLNIASLCRWLKTSDAISVILFAVENYSCLSVWTMRNAEQYSNTVTWVVMVDSILFQLHCTMPTINHLLK